ncbi:hypothetical protein PICMEDRAFT_17798 [Pichia membranifaciens NRRL Y-2026]|uniref:NTF2 domain-containing protein n=1 Tax=Pichia membranifaciens NRRL Y-2026 TaxID=763406 RepID=A0A1E3NGX9_9ASCO|nr:hypothetical protein PICMEDRAFT_17798 [Pichia membranifaciens NRRL Y-2026]ODQ45336.1 hypothetical protein PICMEDRAFT_17798 [Pichia membranifaciens NRRL Y-2026]
MTLADYEKDPNHITNDFIKYYYSKLSSDCSKLYQLYAPDAVLKHMDHTSDPFKAISTNYHDFDNIKKYWKSLPSLSGAKLVILTVNTIHNSDNSLVTNVVGELLLREDYEIESVISPTRLFTQTFILQPHPSKDNYDIRSDILTFIPDSDYMNVELNGVSTSVSQDSHSADAFQKSVEEKPTESREQIQQEVVETPPTSKLNNGFNGAENGTSSDSKKYTKNTIPTSSSPSSPSSLATANNTTEQKKSTPTSQPITIPSSSSSEIPSSSTTATSVNTLTRSAETNKSNGVNPTATTSSEPGKKDLTTNSTKIPAQNGTQAAGGAENQTHPQQISTENKNPTPVSSNTPLSTTTIKSNKPSTEASKLHSASPTPPPSSAPSVKQKASSSSSSSSPAAPAQEAKAPAASQPASSASSTWASALKITNKPASPLLSQSQTVAQQSHSQPSPKSASTQLSSSAASSSTVTSSASTSGNANQLNRPQLYEIYVNFKNSAVPVDEIDLKSAFSSNKFKHFTIVTINKNNTAIVGFNSQEEQARALALGKIIQGETQFGIDKREKKTNGKKRSSTFKNANKRN